MIVAYNSLRWFSLRFAVYHLWNLRKKFGEEVTTENEYQKEREAWIVAVALLGISKMTNTTWWVQIPEEDPPDILALTITPDMDKGWNYANYRKVEVMEITKHSSGDIISEIIEKLEDKYYEKETCLIVYLRRDLKIEDMTELSNKLKAKVKRISDVWLVGNTKPETNDFILFSLFPDVQVVRYNVDEEISKLPPGDTLDLERAKGTTMELIRGIFISKFNPYK